MSLTLWIRFGRTRPELDHANNGASRKSIVKFRDAKTANLGSFDLGDDQHISRRTFVSLSYLHFRDVSAILG